MARRKRGSRVLDHAEKRYAGLESIDVELNLGGELSLERYRELMEQLRGELRDYNRILSQGDRAANAIQATEQQLKEISARMLLGIATHYGRDSHEYEMAGGTRRSEYKRSNRQEEDELEDAVVEMETVI